MKQRWAGMLVGTTVLLVAGGGFAKSAAAPLGTPTRAIQDLDDTIGTFRTGDRLSEEDRKFNGDLKHRIIHGTFDIRELCKRALAKHWGERSAAEQNRFVELMIALLEERALFSKEQAAAKGKSGSKYRVTYLGEKYLDAEKRTALVRTRMVIPSERVNVTLNYRLKKNSEMWKVFDIVVDEASLVDNYRYQFHSIITKNGYAELIRRMEQKLGEIRAKRRPDSNE